ncbi:MAG: hypothetical protein K2O01_08435, partial [Bacteroidales bacterium]|nr:hypothetical protein [Bacteroidales bacterium]
MSLRYAIQFLTLCAGRLSGKAGAMVFAAGLVLCGGLDGGAATAQTRVSASPRPRMATIAYPAETFMDDSAVAAILAAPPKPIRIDYDANVICYGDSLEIKVVNESGPIVQPIYEWYYNGQRFDAEPTQTRIVFSPSSNNIRVWFKLYDGDRLIGSDTMTVYVTDPPTGYTMQHDTICLGEEATVGVAGTVGGSAGQLWDWTAACNTKCNN